MRRSTLTTAVAAPAILALSVFVAGCASEDGDAEETGDAGVEEDAGDEEMTDEATDESTDA